MLRAIAAATLVAVFASGSARAEDDSMTFESCRGCHGPTAGTGAVPALAGRSFQDLLDKMVAFSADATGSTIMHRFLAGMPAPELESLALYISQFKEPSQ